MPASTLQTRDHYGRHVLLELHDSDLHLEEREEELCFPDALLTRELHNRLKLPCADKRGM